MSHNYSSIQDKYNKRINQLIDNESEQHDKIEYNEEIFENEEQKIGIELLNCREVNEISEIYNNYCKKGHLVSINSLTMMIYFLGKQKADIEDIEDMVDDIIKQKDNQIEYQVLSTLCSGLSNINKEGKQYSYELQDLIKQKIVEMIELFESHNCIVMMNSVHKIMEDENEIIEVSELVLRRFTDQIQTVDLNYVITIIQQISLIQVQTQQNAIQNIKPEIQKVCQHLINVNSELDFGQIIAVLDNLIFIDHCDPELTDRLLERLIEIQMDDPNDVLRVLQSSIDIIRSDNIVKTVLKKVVQLRQFMNCDGYSDVWTIIAKLYHKQQQQQTVSTKIITILKQMVMDNQIQVNGFNVFQQSNILVCASIVRLDDFAFIGFFQRLVNQHLSVIDNQQLVNLARVSVVYVKEHDEFIVDLHDELVDRIHFLTREDKKYLIDTFKRCSILFPMSPFLI